MQLSKSEYMMFLKHPAWLWLKKHDKAQLPKPDANLQAIFDAGTEFEQYANKLFPDGVEIGFEDFSQYRSMPERTQKALDDGADVLFQGRFEADGITCIVDALERVEGNTFNLYEVKSSTRVKKEHYHDLAFQTVVLEAAGLHVQNIFVIHVNRDYVRDGEVDPKEFTVVTNITAEAKELLEETKDNIKIAKGIIDREHMPDPSPRHLNMGAFSDWMEIYKNVRDVHPYSIYNLAAPGSRRIGDLEDMDVQFIEDIPDGFDLTPRQQRQVEATKRDERIVHEEKIQQFLRSLTYPLYFLDYETAMSTVPLYDGTRPYQQVPFQYSLHIIEEPGGEVVHTEYLHTDSSNPVPALLEQLEQDIGQKGDVIVWYKPFETKRNKEMADMMPEYADFLHDVNDRVVDLMDPFYHGWFVDKEFFGSASIKKVLPVLVPELTYDDLDVQEGGAAQRLWMDEVLRGKGEIERERLFENLLEYCKLDTLAMVKIWERLREI